MSKPKSAYFIGRIFIPEDELVGIIKTLCQAGQEDFCILYVDGRFILHKASAPIKKDAREILMEAGLICDPANNSSRIDTTDGRQ